MTNPTISWASGSRFKSDPKEAARIISDVQAEDRFAQASAVVDAARPTDSPIHEDFEWDDAVAAEIHRADRARSMLRSLVITVENADPEPLFCHVRVDGDGGYMETRTALGAVEVREWLLSDARRDAKIFREKYKHLKEMAEVIASIIKAI